jgi:hypothetical protein
MAVGIRRGEGRFIGATHRGIPDSIAAFQADHPIGLVGDAPRSRATRTAGTRWSDAAAAAGDLGVPLQQQRIQPGIIAPAAAASLISASWASRTACQVDGRRRGLATFAPGCSPR